MVVLVVSARLFLLPLGRIWSPSNEGGGHCFFVCFVFMYFSWLLDGSRTFVKKPNSWKTIQSKPKDEVQDTSFNHCYSVNQIKGRLFFTFFLLWPSSFSHFNLSYHSFSQNCLYCASNTANRTKSYIIDSDAWLCLSSWYVFTININ